MALGSGRGGRGRPDARPRAGAPRGAAPPLPAFGARVPPSPLRCPRREGGCGAARSLLGLLRAALPPSPTLPVSVEGRHCSSGCPRVGYSAAAASLLGAYCSGHGCVRSLSRLALQCSERPVCACPGEVFPSLALFLVRSCRERGNVGLEVRGGQGPSLRDSICPSFPVPTRSCAKASAQAWCYHATEAVLLAEAFKRVLVSSCGRGCLCPCLLTGQEEGPGSSPENSSLASISWRRAYSLPCHL